MLSKTNAHCPLPPPRPPRTDIAIHRGSLAGPKNGQKILKKNHSVFHTKMMSESRLEHDFLKKASF